MSDDVFETLGDDELFAEDEQQPEPTAGGNQNRAFIIAVAVLGGLLVCALISFGVWALVLNRPQEAKSRIGEVTEATMPEVAVEATTIPEALAPTEMPAPTETSAPTDTPEPTSTPLLGPTATPVPEEGEAEEGEAEEGGIVEEGDAETSAALAAADVTPTATQAPRRTPTPTRTPAATATPRTSDSQTNLGTTSGQLSETGLGEWLLIGAAVVLVAVMMTARKLRKT